MNKFIRWPQMVAVLGILRKTFEENKYADKGIELEFKHNRQWGAKDRRIIAEATYDMLRWWRRIHFYLDWDWQKEKSEEDYWKLALTWMYWRDYPKPVWEVAQGFDYEYIDKNIKTKKCEAADRTSIPNELYDLGIKELNGRWEDFLDVLNHQAPVFLRTNTLKTKPENLQKLLEQEGINASVIEGTEGLKLNERKNVFISEAYKKGLFEVQDLGSQQIAKFLNVQPGDRVIDACSGSGGKSLHLASLMKNKGKIISLDIHEWKLKEQRKRAKRGGVDIIECRTISDSKVLKRLKQTADRLLLDVPCSGLGVLKTSPDTKWKMGERRLKELHLIQENIFTDYSKMLKPGGELVYATCSVLPSENENQVKKFLVQNNEAWQLLDECHLNPEIEGGDGFYMARLKRK